MNKVFLTAFLYGSLLCLLAQPFFGNAQDLEAGKKLFQTNCAACHKVEGKLIGPGLRGSVERWENAGDFQGISGKEWLYKWTRNSRSVIDANYPYAVALFNEYNQVPMNNFPQLSDTDLDNLFSWLDSDLAIAAPKVSTADGEVAETAQVSGISDSFLFWLLAGLIVLLALVSLILFRVYSILNRIRKEKEGIEIVEGEPFYKSPKLAGLIGILVIVFIGYTLADNAIHLGRQQGYMPDQPIKFSHKLHAGLNQIDCQYCHSGASKGKSAIIPSTNVCMNCHAAVNEGPNYGATEIQKIYDAYENNTPVEWVRIHNLPDHVYFSHAQHVNAGKIACQTCHGPVEEMEVLYQHAPLSMGWCINCHRETEVQFAANDYYTTYEKFHKQLKEGKIRKVTVEDIGGLECQKCHY